jgi:hypothetical protein
MTDTQQLGLTGRIVLLVLGTALFLDLAILPYAMYFQFAADFTVHVTVLATTTVILLLLWLATAFGPLKTPQ